MKFIVFLTLAVLLPAAPPVPPGPRMNKPESAPIPMKETTELSDVWAKTSARMSDDDKAWKGINNVLEIKAGTLHPSKVERLAGAYTLALSAKSPGTQALAADPLLEADIPEVTRELLLHPIPGIAAAAARHLAKPAAGEKGKTPGTAAETAMRDAQAVPFLIYVLNRNNYIGFGDEEATIHMLLQRHLVNAILYITEAENSVGAVNIGEEDYIDSVLAWARKWAAEKGLQPLEKQRPPKGEPPTDSKPVPAPTVPPGAKSVAPADQSAPNP